MPPHGIKILKKVISKKRKKENRKIHPLPVGEQAESSRKFRRMHKSLLESLEMGRGYVGNMTSTKQ